MAASKKDFDLTDTNQAFIDCVLAFSRNLESDHVSNEL